MPPRTQRSKLKPTEPDAANTLDGVEKTAGHDGQPAVEKAITTKQDNGKRIRK